MGSRPERVDGHIGIENGPDSYGRQQLRIFHNGMGGSLMERRRVSDEGREVVKLFSGGGISGAGNGPAMTLGPE